VLRDKAQAFGAMGDQDMLQSVDLLYFRGFRIYPIHHLILGSVPEHGLVVGAEQAVQVDPPVTIPLLPPIEIDVKVCLQGGLYQAQSFHVRHN
jgi:hypothetical protein